MGAQVEAWRGEDLPEAQGTPGIQRWVVSEDDGHWFGRAVAQADAEVVLVRVGEGPPVFPADGPDPVDA